MPEDYRIIGSALEELDDDAFREHARAALEEFCRMEARDEDWEAFSERLASRPARADALADGRRAAPSRRSAREARRLHYLSVPPSAAGPSCARSARPGSPRARA